MMPGTFCCRTCGIWPESFARNIGRAHGGDTARDFVARNLAACQRRRLDVFADGRLGRVEHRCRCRCGGGRGCLFGYRLFRSGLLRDRLLFLNDLDLGKLTICSRRAGSAALGAGAAGGGASWASAAVTIASTRASCSAYCRTVIWRVIPFLFLRVSTPPSQHSPNTLPSGYGCFP